MALTTACTDSPSKLKVAEPLLAPPSEGSGALAALRLIICPLPRRICACGPVTGASSSFMAAVCAAPGTTSPVAAGAVRRTSGTGVLAQPASRPRQRENRITRNVMPALYCVLPGVAGGGVGCACCCRSCARRCSMR